MSATSKPHSASRHPAAKPGLQLILILGVLTAFSPLTTDMYLPAFPAIASELKVPAEMVQQTLALFFLGMASGQLIYGPISDRFGRRKPLLAGLTLYIVASIACALATSIQALTFWRLLQGLGGCSGIVMARAVVRDRFDSVNAAHVLSQLTLVMGIAPILAPFLGGQLLVYLGWRAIFWGLTLFGLACAAAVIFGLEESIGEHRSSMHPWTVAKTFGAILMDRTFLLPALTVGFSQAAMFTYIMGSPNVFIKHFGVAPDHFGYFFGVNALGLIGATQINRKLLKKHFPYHILHYSTAAAALAGVLVAVMGWTEIGGLWGLAISLFLLLSALGFVGANGTACALANQGRRAGSASALIGALQFALASLAGACAAHASLSPWIGTPLRSMATFVALCTLIAGGFHWCSIGSKTEKLGAWMRRVTKRYGGSE